MGHHLQNQIARKRGHMEGRVEIERYPLNLQPTDGHGPSVLLNVFRYWSANIEQTAIEKAGLLTGAPWLALRAFAQENGFNPIMLDLGRIGGPAGDPRMLIHAKMPVVTAWDPHVTGDYGFVTITGYDDRQRLLMIQTAQSVDPIELDYHTFNRMHADCGWPAIVALPPREMGRWDDAGVAATNAPIAEGWIAIDERVAQADFAAARTASDRLRATDLSKGADGELIHPVVEQQALRIALRQGDGQQAARICDDWLDLHPHSIWAVRGAADAAVLLGLLPKALKLYRRLVKLTPRNAAHWTLLGEVELALRHTKRARHAFRRAIAVNGTSVNARRRMAELEAARGRLEEALRHAMVADGTALARGLSAPEEFRTLLAHLQRNTRLSDASEEILSLTGPPPAEEDEDDEDNTDTVIMRAVSANGDDTAGAPMVPVVPPGDAQEGST
jgi:hypothetical protein